MAYKTIYNPQSVSVGSVALEGAKSFSVQQQGGSQGIIGDNDVYERGVVPGGISTRLSIQANEILSTGLTMGATYSQVSCSFDIANSASNAACVVKNAVFIGRTPNASGGASQSGCTYSFHCYSSDGSTDPVTWTL